MTANEQKPETKVPSKSTIEVVETCPRCGSSYWEGHEDCIECWAGAQQEYFDVVEGNR